VFPVDTAAAVHATVRAATSNLDDIRRAMAQATQQDRPVNYSPGVAGHQHTRVCPVCRPQLKGVNLAKCICPERCSWPHCTKRHVRTDPHLYSIGFQAPPVPTFRKEAAA
jgi:hypothetical protein